MSSLSSVPNDTVKNVSLNSHVAKIKWGIPKVLFPIILGICTAFLFYQTWLVQQSCTPMMGSGGINCPISHIVIKPKKIVLAQEETQGVTIALSLKSGKQSEKSPLVIVNRTLRWESSDPKIFSIESVDSSGSRDNSEQLRLLGHQPGEAMLTVFSKKDPSAASSIQVTTKGVESLEINPKHLSLQAGQKERLEAVVKHFGKVNQKVVWHSNNEAIVTINSKGQVKAISEGETVIIAESKFDSSKVAETQVSVQPINDTTTPDHPRLRVIQILHKSIGKLIH